MADPAQRPGVARVVVCDSHFAIQKALERTIDAAADLELVETCGSVNDLSELLASKRADVLVLEITIPGAVGLNLIRSLKAQFPNLRIAVYTMYDEVIYGARATRAGASVYVMKSHSTQRVLQGIRASLRNERMHSEAIAPLLTTPSATLHPTNALTDEEMCVFQLLGEGLSVDSISERLGLPRSVVDELERQSVAKLGFDSREALVQYASQIVHK